MTLYSLKSKPENSLLKRCLHTKTWAAKQMHSASDTEGAIDERTGQSHFSIQINVHDNQSKFCMQISLMSARKDFEWQTFNKVKVSFQIIHNCFLVNWKQAKTITAFHPAAAFFTTLKHILKNFET